MFNDTDWTKKAAQKHVCTMPKTWQHLRPTSSQDFGASCGPRRKVRGGTQIPKHLKENEISSHCRWLTYSSVTLHIQYIQNQCNCRLGNGGNDEQITASTCDNKKRLIKTILASNLSCVYNRICQWCDTEKLVPTPRRANRSRPRAVYMNYAKKPRKKTTRSRWLVAATH